MTSALSRRQFVAGLVAAFATPELIKRIAPKSEWWTTIYVEGRGEVQTFNYLESMSQQIARTIIYGNPDTSPTQFRGFQPFFNSIEETPSELSAPSRGPSTCLPASWPPEPRPSPGRESELSAALPA